MRRSLKTWNQMQTRQFEVWLADLSPRFGTEPGKIRPVLVIQTDLLNHVHPSTLVCPITTNVQPASVILRVNLPAGTCNMKLESDIMIDQIRAIDNRSIQKKLGKLTPKLAKKSTGEFADSVTTLAFLVRLSPIMVAALQNMQPVFLHFINQPVFRVDSSAPTA